MNPVYLKVYIAGFVAHIKEYKKTEKKILGYARYLLGVSTFPKKHPMGKDKPQVPEPRDPVDAPKSEEFYKTYQNLQHHRKEYLRREVRYSLLAYGFLRDKPYSQLEAHGSYEEPDWDAIYDIIEEVFEHEDVRAWNQKFAEWRDEAQAYWEENNLNKVETTSEFPKERVAA